MRIFQPTVLLPSGRNKRDLPPSLLSSLLCATMVSEHKFVVAYPELRDEVVRAITALAIGNDA